MSTTQPIKSKGKLEQFRNYYKDVEWNPRNYALIVLGLNSALRISDILSLRWKHVYSETDEKFRNHIIVNEQKTGKEKILAINPPAKEALDLYRTSLSEISEKHYILRGGSVPIKN